MTLPDKYSGWHGVQAGAQDGGSSIGWGNPPGANWVNIPDAWADNVDITRCYFKGCYSTAHSVVYEIGRNSDVANSFNGSGSFADHQGSYGNTATGSFSNANRPHRRCSRRTGFAARQRLHQTPIAAYDP